MKKEYYCHICGAYFPVEKLKEITKKSKFAKSLITIKYCEDCEIEAKETINEF